MQQQFVFTFPDEVDLKNVANIQIYKGFILTLPFRIRTGKIFSVQIGDSFDVIFRNRLDIPYGTSPDEVLDLMWVDKKFRPREQFFTEALIIDKNVTVTKDFREHFDALTDSGSDQKIPDSKTRYFEAITSLNDAIVGYHHATNSLFGGTVVERLTIQTFFERIRYLHTIVSPSGYELSHADLFEILDARSEREFVQIGGQFATSQMDDVPAEQLDSIQRYAKLHQQFLFYQFALDAKSKMAEQDYVTAILFAVIALEGVHSALLQMRVDRQVAESITDTTIRTKKVEATVNRMLKDIGLSESLEMTSLLFLDGENRPPEDEMRNCKLGITIRNEIMHALAKKGQYRLRNRTNKQITEAYSSVIKMFNSFATIVERDIEAESAVEKHKQD